MRQALARRCRPVMGGDQLMLRVVELHRTGPIPEPQRLAHQPIRRRIVGTGEGHVAIPVDGDALPDRQDVRCRRQRPQRCLLDGVETLQRLLLGRAVRASAGDRDTPAAQRRVERIHRLRRTVQRAAARQEVALDVVHPTLFHLALEMRAVRRVGVDEEAIVFSALAVCCWASGSVKLARTTAALRLSGTTRCGTPPKQAKACWWHNNQVSTRWSKTSSA